MLNRVGKRKALKPRREPYWARLSQGQSLGYRRLTTSSSGSWIARFYDGERYQQKPLGDFANLPEEARYDAAKKTAEEWLGYINMGGTTAKMTVKHACESYVDTLRQVKGDASAHDTAGRFRRLVDSDPIARVDLAKLAPRHVAEWKTRTLTKGGSRGYYNRNATALRAALNLAKSRREVATDQAWAEELKPLEGVAARRTLYLDRDARRSLIENASDELRPLVTALSLLPLRPGELVNARVEHLDVKHAMLRVTGKTGSREVPLACEALTFLRSQSKDKLPAAWLISRDDGRQWSRFTWREGVKLAAAGAKLPRSTCLYTLRHSTITDLVSGGLDLFHVAKISGTSVRMIEQHYAQLRQELAREALAGLSLKK